MKEEIKQFIQLIPQLQFESGRLFEDLKWYFDFVNNSSQEEQLHIEMNEINCLNQEEIVEKQMEIYQRSINRIEETIQRRKNIEESTNTMYSLMNAIGEKLELLSSSIQSDFLSLYKVNNDIIDSIIQLKKQQMDNELQEIKKYISEMCQNFETTKNHWLQKKVYINQNDIQNEIEIEPENENQNEIQNEIAIENENEAEIEIKNEQINQLNQIITNEEINQIQQWTKKQIGEIIFSSTIDDWKTETSIFDQKLLNKNNIIIIIEDTEGNKFGGYISSTIDKCNSYISDKNAFLFSLQSNERLSGMKRFEIKDSQKAFYLGSSSDVDLFGMGSGYDLCLRKENTKSQCCCYQSYSFYYNGSSNALVGKSPFNTITLKQFHVLQMN